MNFANPLFFWALLSLAIPIIIHLFRFRKFRVVYFTNVRFLRELQKESNSQSRLRHLLVLIARCLALASLITAFAQPFIPSTRKTVSGERAISIFIDNSFSMDAQGESSNLLDLAKKHALDIVESYKPSDRFQLLTNDFEGIHQRLLTREQFAEALKQINPSPASKKLSEVIQRQKDLLIQSGVANRIAYLISDFQKATADISATKGDSMMVLNCVHLQPQLSDNISIDSVWFSSPHREKGKPDQVTVMASNHTEKRFDNIPVKLSINNTQKGLETFSFGPDSAIRKNIGFTSSEAGLHSGEIQLTDYPIVFDDAFYLSWNVPEKINILCIEGEGNNDYLSQLYEKNPAFLYKHVSEQQVDYSELPGNQLILLDRIASISSGLTQELKKYTANGGTVVTIPSLKTNPEAWRSFSLTLGAGAYASAMQTNQKVNQLNASHRIYDDVFEKNPQNIDLPVVKNYIPFKAVAGAKEEVIMRLQNGDPFLAGYDAGKGKIYMCSVPLDDAASNFHKHALLIPTFYKIALYSIPPSRLYYTIGREEPIELSNVVLTGDKTLRIQSLKGDMEVIPEHRVSEGKVLIYVYNQIRKAGNYLIKLDDVTLARVSFNYSRDESIPEFMSSEDMEESLKKSGWVHANILDGSAKELKQTVAGLDEGKPLWKIFIILSLVFLAAEILLIRFLK